MRSCVTGGAGGIFSSTSAMGFASGNPTQIDNERLSSSSRRTIMGILDSGSNTRFLTFISSHMAFLLESCPDRLCQRATEAMRQRLGDLYRHDRAEKPAPLGVEIHDAVASRPPRCFARVLSRHPIDEDGQDAAGEATALLSRASARDLEQHGIALGLPRVGDLIRHVRRRGARPA